MAPAERDDGGLVAALKAVIGDAEPGTGIRRLALALPAEADIAREIGHDVDPDAIFRARTALRGIAGRALGSGLWQHLSRMPSEEPYSPRCGERRTPRAAQHLRSISGRNG